MKSAGAILLGAALISASIVFAFRWDISPINTRIGVGALRLDRWTGAVGWCQAISTPPSDLRCTVGDDWQPVPASQAAPPWDDWKNDPQWKDFNLHPPQAKDK